MTSWASLSNRRSANLCPIDHVVLIPVANAPDRNDHHKQNPAGFVSWQGLCLVAGIGFTAFAALGVDARPAGAGLGPNDRFIHRSG